MQAGNSTGQGIAISQTTITRILTDVIYYIWVVALLLASIVAQPAITGWIIVAIAVFLILPYYWRKRAALGRNAHLGPRLLLAGLFTFAVMHVAWGCVGDDIYLLPSEARSAVAAQLRDPSSAEFRDIKEGTSATCGEVNGKNAYGAYGGYKKFVYASGEVLLEPEEPVGASIKQMTDYYNATATFFRESQKCYN